ncbi:MAG: hypothetical protein ACYDAG_04360 [Chloroflexota bacterium]
MRISVKISGNSEHMNQPVARVSRRGRTFVASAILAPWLALMILLAVPLPAQAQTGGATPIAQPQSSAANQQAPRNGQVSTGSTSAHPSPAPVGARAATAAATPVQQPQGDATPVGSNIQKVQPEPVSLFAYALIVVAALWLVFSLIGIVRLLTRPGVRGLGGSYYPVSAADIPPAEKGRGFLSFGAPFVVLACVFVLVVGWGNLFLALPELYTLVGDFLIICLVMGIATLLALRGGASGSGSGHSELH